VAPGEGALSARTVLEVADGLRWSDPRLGRSLAEHALRLAGDDAGTRAAAQRCVIRSLAEVDRFEDIVSWATPLLEDAAVRQDRDDLAGLLVELAVAALGFGDGAVAARLVEPVHRAEDLSDGTTVHAALVRAQVAGATGDVAAADRAAQDAEASLGRTAEPEAGLVRRDLTRARAAARSRSGDPTSALRIVSGVVSADPAGDPDGGRRSLLAAADQVDLLIDLGRPDEALERGRAALPEGAAPPVVRPAARIRLALAERVHLARGGHDEARALARSAGEQLEDAGHDAVAARAWEVVASAAERGNDLGAALAAVRHGHELESRSRDRRDPALRALATLAASAPELPARPAPPTPETPTPETPTPETPAPETPAPESSAPESSAPEPATPEPTAPEPTASEPAPTPSSLSEVESLLADARSSVIEGPLGEVDGSAAPVRRRGHRRQDAGDVSRPPGAESVPETLARLLGGSGGMPQAAAGTAASPTAGELVNGSGHGPDDSGTDSSSEAEVGFSASRSSQPASSARRRHSDGPRDDLLAVPPANPKGEAGLRPTFDAFSTAPGTRRDDQAHFGPGAEPSSPGPTTTGTDRSTGSRQEPAEFPHIDAEFPHIDPADPLGAVTSGGTPARPPEGGAPAGRDGAPSQERGRGVGPTVAGSPRPHPGERPLPEPNGPWGTPAVTPSPIPRPGPASVDREELDDELALTLTGLLAEYRLPDARPFPHPDGVRPPDVAVPSARRHISGSMPLPATDQRFAARADDVPGRVVPAPDDGPPPGRAPRGENGARLANLLAEAMDAFRHTGSEESSWGNGDPPRGNGDPSRGNGDPSRGNGDRGPGDPSRGRGDGTRGPGLGTRRG
jgi:hypothetical protein